MSCPRRAADCFREVSVDFTVEIIQILATYVFFLLAVAVLLSAITVGVVLFAIGEGVVWLRSHRAGSRSYAPGTRFVGFR